MYLLPCEIKYTGIAPVNTYFKPHQTEPDGSVEAAFRGRELKGREVRLADHQLSGWLLKDTVQGAHASLVRDRAAPHKCVRMLARLLMKPCPCRAIPGSIADGEQRRWVAAGTFSSLTCYKHDDPPFDDDPIHKAIQWVDIANVLHAEH